MFHISLKFNKILDVIFECTIILLFIYVYAYVCLFVFVGTCVFWGVVGACAFGGQRMTLGVIFSNVIHYL